MQLRIETPHFTADQKLLDYIERKVQKLDQFYDRILFVDVYLKLENSGQIRDKIVDIKINVPGDTLFISETDKTFEAATDTIVDRAKRLLKRHKDQEREHR